MDVTQWKGYRILKSMGIDRDQIKDVDVLILPENFESEQDVKKFYNANHSITLYKLLKSCDVNVNLLNDLGVPDTPVLAKHSDEIWLGVIFLQYFAIPVLVNVISDWLLNRATDSIVHVNLHFNDQGELTSLKYDGNAKTLENILAAMNKK